MSLRPLLLAAALCAPAAAQDVPSFTAHIQPLLTATCAGCHQPAKAEGRLDLTSHAALLRGGHGGPSVVPGDPEGSLLLELVQPFEGEAPEMPPKGEPLAADQVALLERWIAAGAPNDTPPEAAPFTSENPPRYPRLPVVSDLAFSPAGDLLAVTGRHELLLYRVDGHALALEARLIGLSERLESLAFSPDGQQLAAAGGTPGLRGELQLWDVAQRRLTQSMLLPGDCLHGVSWSPDGSRVAFGCPDTSLRAIDARSSEPVLFNAAHEDWVLSTAWSTDGSHLVSVSRDRSMKLTLVEEEQFIDNITSITPGALKGGLMSVLRHPTRDELLTAGADGTPRLYRMYREKKRVIGDDYNLLRACEPLAGRVFDLAWGPGAEGFVAGSSDRRGAVPGQLRLATPHDGATVWTRDLPSGCFAVDYHPSGAWVVAAGYDGVLRLFAAADGAPLGELPAAPLEETP